jgi:tetratricopeptide (TPR) repeat protein
MQRLSEPARAFWRRLSVFETSFSPDAAVAAAGKDMTPEQAVDLLDQLVAQGLISIDPQSKAMRYYLPAALRSTANAETIDQQEEEAVYHRLLAFYTTLAEQMLDQAFGPQRSTWMQRLEQEHANIGAILNWVVAQGHAEHGLQLAYLLQELWFEEDYTSEGRSWFTSLLALPQAAARTSLRAQALDLAGALALNQGDYAIARALKQEGLAIFRELGDQVRVGYALLHLGHLVGYAQENFSAARKLYQEGLDILRGAFHVEGTAHALANLANVAILTSDYASAGPLVQESLQIYRELGSAYDMALSVERAAGIAAGTDHPERALRLAGASATHLTALGVSRPRIFQERSERMIEQARRALNESVQNALLAEGQVLSLEQAVAYALEQPAAAI